MDAEPIRVEPQDPERQSSEITDEPVAEVDVRRLEGIDPSLVTCLWNGEGYPGGTALECEGRVYVCRRDGRWAQAGAF